MLQFTVIPMLAMIAADTTSRLGDDGRSAHHAAQENRTVVFKTTTVPTL
jgi:hypothetical protein